MENPKTTTGSAADGEIFPRSFIDELSRLESGPAWNRKPSGINTSALTSQIGDSAIVGGFQRFVKRFELYMSAVLGQRVRDEDGDRVRFDSSVSPKVSCGYANSERASTARLVLEWQGAGDAPPRQTLEGFLKKLHHLYWHRSAEDETFFPPSAFRLRYSRSERFETAIVSDGGVETRKGIRLPAAARRGRGRAPTSRPHYALTVVILKRHGKKRERPREVRRGGEGSTPLVITKRQRISDVRDGK